MSNPAIQLQQWFRLEVEDKAIQAAGGPARLRVIVLLASVLALDSADKAMIGAVAVALKQSMGIGNLKLAMLVAGPTLVTALASLPAGVLSDRINRTRLLAASIAVWAVLMVVGGVAVSYLMLLLSRLALGAAVAVTIPAVASLTGDYFQPGERARIWGYILAGELAGVAIGYLIAGNIAAVLSWRASFWTLGAISLAIVPLVWRFLPEPVRGGQSRIEPETQDTQREDERSTAGEDENEVEAAVAERDIEPHESLVLHENPARLPFGRAVRYVLQIRTNVVLIISSALGYFFFGAIVTFGIVFMRNRFGLGQAVATTLSVGLGAGAIIGVLISGRIADKLIDRGRINARILVPIVAFLLAAALFLPALLVHSLFVAAPALFLAAAALGATNPPIDAARLDIMHFQLWGRAESVRAALRYLGQAIAPLVFAGIFILLSGGGSLFSIATGNIQQDANALARTFLIMLVALIAAGLILLPALRTYSRDVATARASEQATSDDS